jgi:CheY-like chemotaxis protein
MPSYRLLAGHGAVIDAFVAIDDARAIDCARELTEDLPTLDSGLDVSGGFRLERQDGCGWQVLFWWVPPGAETTLSARTLPRSVTDAPPILLVDDDVAILDGLRRQLRNRFTVHTANGGAEALELMKSVAVTVVVSEMLQAKEAPFLSQVRSLYPNVVRILLTARVDTQAATMAVEAGLIYRFLTKPCPPEALLEAIESAVDEYNRVVTTKKEFLQTWRWR